MQAHVYSVKLISIIVSNYDRKEKIMGFTRKKLLGVFNVSGDIEAIKTWCRQTFSILGHNHTKSDITDFAHTHPINEVNGLQSVLDGKSNISHNHDTRYATSSHTHSEYAPISHTHELTTVTAYIYVIPTITGATGTMGVVKGTVSINPGTLTEAWSYSITLTNDSGTKTLKSGVIPTKMDIEVSEAGTLKYSFSGQGYHDPTTGIVGSISQTRFGNAIPL